MSKRFIKWGLGCSLITATIMALAGRWADPWLWTYAAVCWTTSFYGMVSIDENLARERFSPPEPGADRLPLRAMRLLALAHLVVAPLDLRWHLGPAVSPVLRALALAGMAVGFFLVFRAMKENYFFSPVVRIQTERGHRVVTTGPYSVIRHPGYAGMILGVPLSGLALGSWLSAALALLYAALILRRVIFEDGFLQRSLDGYAAYAMRVRYRLVPGIW